jgi:HAD superfamily hydrolase (TIGR01459 family)
MNYELLSGVAALADRFDGVVLDQWGVLHDGSRPYPGAIHCLERLRAAGKRVVIVSNSGKRSAPNVALMAALGFAPALYDDLIAAGEDVWRGLRHRPDAFYQSVGKRCLVIAREALPELLAGLDIERVRSVEVADFILLLGNEGAVDAYDGLLQRAAARGLPLICANPDLVRFTASGIEPAPGAVARRYEAMGGAVHYHGKPHPPIYESALRALGLGDRGRIVAIGDSLDHDIRGAAAVGLASALVVGGIYAEELGWPPDPGRLDALVEEAGARPRFLLPSFVW